MLNNNHDNCVRDEKKSRYNLTIIEGRDGEEVIVVRIH